MNYFEKLENLVIKIFIGKRYHELCDNENILYNPNDPNYFKKIEHLLTKYFIGKKYIFLNNDEKTLFIHIAKNNKMCVGRFSIIYKEELC